MDRSIAISAVVLAGVVAGVVILVVRRRQREPSDEVDAVIARQVRTIEIETYAELDYADRIRHDTFAADLAYLLASTDSETDGIG